MVIVTQCQSARIRAVLMLNPLCIVKHTSPGQLGLAASVYINEPGVGAYSVDKYAYSCTRGHNFYCMLFIGYKDAQLSNTRGPLKIDRRAE